MAAYVEASLASAAFWDRMTTLLELLLPRYAADGKKCYTLVLGCTGGRHRFVFAAERLASHFARLGLCIGFSHREPRVVAGSTASRRTQESKDQAFLS